MRAAIVALTWVCGLAASCSGGSTVSRTPGPNVGGPNVGEDLDGAAGPPSCRAGGPGMTHCGAGGGGTESCCTSLPVSGGSYDRTYDFQGSEAGAGPSEEADPATVSAFRLDKYLVTVGRFRPFVNAWNGGAGYVPPAGSGKHTHLNGGLGLADCATPGTFEPGWVAADDSNVAPTSANLLCDPTPGTWTVTPGDNEMLPINCVDWYEAYAFCIWDGGFLPSEAEWEYAAAGGSQQREYPWGSTDPGAGYQYAIYGDGQANCYYPDDGAACTGIANMAPVGTASLGAGLWGQLDLAGDAFEWNLDWYAPYVVPAVDCAYLPPASGRVYRGGSFYSTKTYLAAAYRNDPPATTRFNYIGFRCARTP
jgi:sulfatase modifying factor 1